MEVVMLVLVVVAILSAIVSGVWVAIALIKAISTNGRGPAARRRTNEESST